MLSCSKHSFSNFLATCLISNCQLGILTSSRWAWQNPHVTLHIPPESRIQHATQKKRSGQPKRPCHTVHSLISNLHLLLRVPSFSRLPLDVRFFNEDVHKAWLNWTKAAAEPIRDSIPIITDFPPADSAPGNESDGSPRTKKRKTSHGIAALDVDYAKEKDYVKKAKEVIDFEREGACSVCHEDLEHDAGIYTICPNHGCETVAHITCLSKHFLENDEDSIVPIKGSCPSCKVELRWVDVVRELSLRMRGQKAVEKLLKGKRTRTAEATALQPIIEPSDIDEGEDDDDMEKDIYEEIKRLQGLNLTESRMDMGDTWHDIDDSDDSDAPPVASAASQSTKAASGTSKTRALGTVIEDSDWDDALVLD
jgi:structure-specific endonuclease subunit SLX1